MSQLDQAFDMLKEDLVKLIDVTEYVRKRINPSWSGDENDLLPCLRAGERHSEADDSTPSLSINSGTGQFVCFGCGWKGTSAVGLHTDAFCDGNFKKALVELFEEYVRPVIPMQEINSAHKSLLKKPRLLQKIMAIRGWSKDTVKALRLGWDSERKRVVIPYFNLQGFCVDVRYHDTVKQATSRQEFSLIARKGGRKGDFLPINPKNNPFDPSRHEVWIVEGESDLILAYQDGLNAVTVSGGAGVWKSLDHAKLKSFRGKEVIVCMDNDKAGQEAAEEIAKSLSAVEIASLKNITVPQGNDISDFFLKYGGGGDQLRQVAALTTYTIKPQKRNVQVVPLSETSKAEHVGHYLKSDVLINGKHHTPQAVPRRLEVSCSGEEPCSACPCRQDGRYEHHVLSDDKNILDWLYAKDFGTQLKKELCLPSRCRMKAEVTEWQNLEQVTMIPALSNRRSEDKNSYVIRTGYFTGHGLESNQTYNISAMPVVHPKNKESVLVVDKATGTYDSISQFRLTPEEIEHLKQVFSDDPKKIITDICRMLSHNHTKIYKRWDLHAVVDLCFHSPRDFAFGGVQLPKGSLEILLFGDTRCGKGQVAEGLVRFYDLGEVISGENASFMGLCGGAQKVSDSFQLSWGAIPLNHGRLVVIDEFSGLGDDVLARLSRVRSEGIAEINKGGINSKTEANARLIWIANPRKGKEMADFAHGAGAIMDLVKTNEDVARFDLAVVVQKGEVDVNEINQLRTRTHRSKYHQEDLRKVVLWAWSRQADHVMFTRRTTEYILQAASDMSQVYTDTIPLIQGENARFKIAKIAAAIAARCFSTPDGQLLRVEERHAHLAVSLIHHFYGKPSMGYRQFSALEQGTHQLTDIHILDDFMQPWPPHQRRLFIDGMLSVNKFGVREVQDWLDVDAAIAKKFIGRFVRCQGIKQLSMGLYVKKPAFIKYLKRQRRKLNVD